jgi:hypothetical protein
VYLTSVFSIGFLVLVRLRLACCALKQSKTQSIQCSELRPWTRLQTHVCIRHIQNPQSDWYASPLAALHCSITHHGEGAGLVKDLHCNTTCIYRDQVTTTKLIQKGPMDSTEAQDPKQLQSRAWLHSPTLVIKRKHIRLTHRGHGASSYGLWRIAIDDYSYAMQTCSTVVLLAGLTLWPRAPT